MEDINKYIDQKYMDFKFTLLKTTEEEVKELKNRIVSRGVSGGSLISGPYEIRKRYIDKLFLERVLLEINIRKEYGINVSDDEYNSIIKNILNIIEHEYNFLINATREDANLARMDNSIFENSFLNKINSDLNYLKDTVKRKMEIGKFELDKMIKDNSHMKVQIYDAFLCHASEDKEEIANNLFLELRSKGKKIWYDDFVLKLGDSLRQKIDEGLKYSNYGIVILSKNFFNKNWPKVELDGLFDKEASLGRKVILPIWHKISKEEVRQQSHILAGRFSVSTSGGLNTVVKRILEVIDNDKPDISDSDTLINGKRSLPIKNIKSSPEIEKLIFLFSKSNSYNEAEKLTISLIKFEDKFTKDDILRITDIAINNDQIFNSFGARKILESFFKKYSDIIPFEKIKKFFNNSLFSKNY
ncbi:MAG: toll/interleukin-1 receptor domain-containing protein [Actinobacteria bacterium]|nr:toll/interleukin-1 receptor domain-containing protein [Cyanobacteriota bacterium]MCL5772257.1 toll/interleukin-1 receptor domain-containing protein [Actinomycetota bacterium]